MYPPPPLDRRVHIFFSLIFSFDEKSVFCLVRLGGLSLSVQTTKKRGRQFSTFVFNRPDDVFLLLDADELPDVDALLFLKVCTKSAR